MINHCSIAGKFLFTGLDNFLLIVVVTDSLNCGQCFSATPLLNSDMNQALLVTLVVGSVCVCEWIKFL